MAVPGQFIVLTTLSAAMQCVPATAVVAGASFQATVGHRLDESALRDWLVRMGFSQAPTVSEPGDYAIRGGIFDIYPPGESGPVRLDLFGDVLDGARRFDPATQRSLEKLQRVEFAPGVRDHPRPARDHPLPAELPGGIRRGGAMTTRFMKLSARAASIRAWNIGCLSSTQKWQPCSTICPAPR